MIVIVTGLPGSGKSYFAAKLAAAIGGVYINSDKVRKSMGASGRYSFNDKLAVYKEMVMITDKSLHEKKLVVIDATFHHHAMRDLFLKLAKQNASSVCFIKVQASEALIKKRLSKPRQDSEADFNVYLQIRDQFEEITEPHLKLRSTDDNITAMLNKAIEYIGGIHEGK